VSGQLHTQADLTPKKAPSLPMNRELGMGQRGCGRFAEENRVLLLLGIDPQFLEYDCLAQRCINLGGPNFVRGCVIFVGVRYGTCIMSPAWCLKFRDGA